MTRFPILILLFCLLAVSGCAPTIRATGPAIVTPRLASDWVLAADAQRLPLRSWLPQGETRAVIVAVHGFNDYSNAFDEPAQFLALRGIATYAFDQRGFGMAPDHGYWAGQQSLADDLATVTRLIAARHPGKPLYLLGESMGGALVMVTMTHADAPSIQGVILSAPAVWDRGSMTLIERGALWVAAHSVPWLTLSGNGLDIKPSDNIEMLRRLSRDPLVIKETRVDAINGLCDLMDNASLAAGGLHLPTLVLYGEHDEVVPAAPMLRMMAQLQGSHVPAVKAVYRSGYHMLLRDLQASTVLSDIVAWIDHPAAPLPSGADRRANALLDDRSATTTATAAVTDSPL